MMQKKHLLPMKGIKVKGARCHEPYQLTTNPLSLKESCFSKYLNPFI